MNVEPSQLRDQVVDDDGTSVVMVGADVLVLSTMATELLRLVAAGCRSTSALTQELVRAFGEPGGDASPEQLVVAQVADLEQCGLLRVVNAT